MLYMLKILLIGILVGVCNIIPGVSGGTMVVIFNIYDEFMDITSMRIKRIFQNWKFTVPLVFGMVAGVLLFSKAITYLYSNFPVQTYYFFTGLIIGSIPLLFNYSYKNQDGTKPGTGKLITLIICTIVGIAIIVGFSFLQKYFGNTDLVNSTLPVLTVGLALKLFIAGMLGAVAMIIPGISGALLMLILGVYPIIIAAIPALFDFATFWNAVFLLIPNGIGILVGLIGGSNLLKFLLKRFPNYTYAVIFGLILGSIINIFPGFNYGGSVLLGIMSFVCLILGTALAYFSAKFSGKAEE